MASINLAAVLPNLEQLHALRKVRNCFIHGGGHISAEKLKQISNIKGINIQGSLVMVSNSFIWDSLEHARIYLGAVAVA